MNYNKTIDKADYETSDTFQHIQNMTGVLNGSYVTWGTEFRLWEYGTGLKMLREAKVKTVLEVGGGSSMFAASAIWAGFDVTVLDPENYQNMFQQQSERIGKQIPFIRADFFDYPEGEMYDSVVCISTIEHVSNDSDFFLKLLRHVKPNGVLFLTSDFHPSGKSLFGGHLRCYNADMFMGLIDLAKEHNFEIFGGTPNYENFEPLIHGMYSFASMALKRKSE